MKNIASQKWWTLILCILCPSLSMAQNKTVSGVVTSSDESIPLEGVVIYVKGSKFQSGSQPDGVYYINVLPNDSVLVFEYDGFITEEIKLIGHTEYNVALKRIDRSQNPFPHGGWRGTFTVQNTLSIPFNFEIGSTGGTTKAWLINAEERFEAGEVLQTQDSLFISLDQFDNELAFKLQGNKATGVLRRQDKSAILLPVNADWGITDRFLHDEKPKVNISGKYEVTFIEEDGSETETVGLFSMEGNKVKATFLKITGDSRFLEGVISGNTIFLSSFIGASPWYYEATVSAEGGLSGFAAGPRSKQFFVGKRNEKAALPDPYSLTYLKPGYTNFDFSFPDLNGKVISLKDPKFKDKVVIVTITGTWCPNCIDEAAFLSKWYKENKNRGVEAIAIHYERKTDAEYLRRVVQGFRNRHGIEYPEVIGGIPDKKKVAESLPALNTFLAFPTILFIDKKGNVAKIYTGFTGPATGKYFEEFKKEFNTEIDKLLKQ